MIQFWILLICLLKWAVWWAQHRRSTWTWPVWTWTWIWTWTCRALAPLAEWPTTRRAANRVAFNSLYTLNGASDASSSLRHRWEISKSTRLLLLLLLRRHWQQVSSDDKRLEYRLKLLSNYLFNKTGSRWEVIVELSVISVVVYNIFSLRKIKRRRSTSPSSKEQILKLDAKGGKKWEKKIIVLV